MSLPLQKSYYAARATSTPITFGQASTGNIQIAIEFEILDEAYAGETMTYIGTFTPDSSARTIEGLQHAGWQGEDLAELDGAPGSEVMPNEISLACEPDSYNGETRLKAKWINRAGGGRFAFKEQVAGNDLKAFAAQMKATVRSVRAGGAPRKPAQQRTPSAPSGGGYDGHPNAPGNGRDDIPF